MNTHCYAIVNEKTGALLLEDAKLPIYWYYKVAKQRLKVARGFYIEKIHLKDLRKFILTHPV